MSSATHPLPDPQPAPARLRAALIAIEASNRLRPVDPAVVEAIAASFNEIGQQSDIVVRPVEGSNTLQLIAGAHRLAAAKLLGWDAIDARYEEADDARARLIEIDENLIRRELSALDRAVFLAERKRIYETLHPETAHGKARKPKKDQTLGKVANLATFARFSKDAARRTGLSERSIQRAMALAGQIPPDIMALLRASAIADNQGQLQALGALAPADQATVAGLLASGAARNVASASRIAGLTQPKATDADEDALARFAALWARASRKARRMIEAHIASQGEDT